MDEAPPKPLLDKLGVRVGMRASFSETHAALRLVIPRALRPKG